MAAELAFSVLGLVVIFLFLVNLLSNGSSKTPKNFPLNAGPPKLLFLGNTLQLMWGGPACVANNLKRFGEVYGKVFSLSVGPLASIMINDHKILRETFQRLDVGARPQISMMMQLHRNKVRGFALLPGVTDDSWKQLRRFTVKELKEFGFGKKSIGGIIEMEATDLIRRLRQRTDTPMSTNALFHIPVSNVLWRLMSGQRFDPDDAQANEMIHAIITLFGQSIPLLLAVLFPKLILKFPKESRFKHVFKTAELVNCFLDDVIQKKESEYKPGTMNDFMDVFIEKVKSTTDPDSCFYGTRGVENLRATVFEMFIAGAETTSTTLRWFLLYMAGYPDVQEKLQHEIDTVLDGRLPTLEDRPKMPYTEAVLLETMRKSSIITGGSHQASEDTVVGGYDIPKGTIVGPSLYSIHHDPEVWGDPENFRPERFLTPDGKSVVKHEAFVAFSVGKRACPGEQLARDELFIFSASLCQRFTFLWGSKDKQPDFTSSFSPVLAPKPHDLILKNRQIAQNDIDLPC